MVRGQKAHRRRDPRIGRHQNLFDAKLGRDLDPVQRPRAAEGHERMVPRINALLHRARADRVGHVGVEDGEHAFGALVHAEVEALGEVADGALRRGLVQGHFAAQEVVLAEPAQDDVGVGDRGQGAAPAISRGTRARSSAARAHAEGTAAVPPGDAAAAGADAVDVDHRDHQRIAGDPGIARRGLAEMAVLDDADVGAGAAHIEGDEFIAVRQIAAPRAAQDARGRARQQGQHGPFRYQAGRGHAPVRAHDVQVGLEAARAHGVLQVGDVGAHLGADEGVHGGRREALEFAELRRDRRRCRHERLGIFLADDLRRAVFVRRVDVAEQETHGDRFDAFLFQFTRGFAHLVLVERSDHLAARRRQPLGHRFAVTALHQRPVLPGDLLHDRIVLRALVAADVDDVAVALGRDHARFGAVVFQDRVGGDGGAVKHVVDGSKVDAVPFAQLRQAGHDRDRGVVRRGRNLMNEGSVLVGVGVNDVGKGAADVDAHELHRACLPKKIRRSDPLEQYPI